MHDASKMKSRKTPDPKPKRKGKSPRSIGKPGFAEVLSQHTKRTQSVSGFKNKWQGCMACPLGATRDEIVLYDAKKLPATILFIGEAPGKQEDATGTPFIGKSGQLLRQMTKQLRTDIGKKSPSWAIANSVCCIPLDDDNEIRVPTTEEQQACFPRLLDFLFLCQPKLVVLLGESAKRVWKKSGLNKTAFDFTDSTPICTLELRHPAYLLRNGASPNREFSENYNGVLDFKRDYLKLRDEAKRLATKANL